MTELNRHEYGKIKHQNEFSISTVVISVVLTSLAQIVPLFSMHTIVMKKFIYKISVTITYLHF